MPEINKNTARVIGDRSRTLSATAILSYARAIVVVVALIALALAEEAKVDRKCGRARVRVCRDRRCATLIGARRPASVFAIVEQEGARLASNQDNALRRAHGVARALSLRFLSA